MDMLIGRQLGAYQLLEELGSGGMATVYRARHTLTNQIVAIKVMHAHLAKDPTYVERFRREAGMALALHSPNVVQVIAIGEQDGTWFIVMEYVEGKTLQRVLRERGALPVVEALEITNQILNALEAAFFQGIVHRDIKPQNIMLASDGNVKVMDLGIARATGSMTLTQTGFFIGTPQYVSPEQAQREQVDIRSDLYSLGIVLYEMLVGIVPFDAETPWVVIRMHLDTKPNPMRRMKRHIPAGVEAIVMRALAKKPEQRFQTPSEMKRAVAEQLRRLQPVPKRVDDNKTVVRPVPKSLNARVSPLLFIPIVAIILVAVFGASVLFSTFQNPSRPTFPTSQIALESTATSLPFTALALKPTQFSTPTNTRHPSTSTATNAPTPIPTFSQTETLTLLPTRTSTQTPTQTATAKIAVRVSTNTPRAANLTPTVVPPSTNTPVPTTIVPENLNAGFQTIQLKDTLNLYWSPQPSRQNRKGYLNNNARLLIHEHGFDSEFETRLVQIRVVVRQEDVFQLSGESRNRLNYQATFYSPIDGSDIGAISGQGLPFAEVFGVSAIDGSKVEVGVWFWVAERVLRLP